jgi:hypothetical protein
MKKTKTKNEDGRRTVIAAALAAIIFFHFIELYWLESLEKKSTALETKITELEGKIDALTNKTEAPFCYAIAPNGQKVFGIDEKAITKECGK